MKHVSLTAMLLLAPLAALADPPPEQCPQPRNTGQAPAGEYERVNPLPASRANLRAGRKLYEARNGCAICHGVTGEGNGPLGPRFRPRPRNFACAQTVNGIPDGQLAWVIRHGSPDTAMPAHADYSDEQVWQLVLYLRELARR